MLYHPIECGEKYIKLLKRVEALDCQYKKVSGLYRIFLKIVRFYKLRKLYKFGAYYNLDIGLHSCAEGLKIWHIAGGVVINENARIGKNLTLHGCNCIGNDGIHPEIAPRIGNNVHLGFGSSVIGDVTLADDIWVAAGAVVVTSFYEPGIVIGGVPAKKIKDNHD